jgi:hypothetical protein
MVPSLGAHAPDFALEDVDGSTEGDLRLVVPLVRDQLSALGLAPDLGLGRTVLMVVAVLDVDHDMDQVLLPAGELPDAGLCRVAATLIEWGHDMPLNVHYPFAPSFCWLALASDWIAIS